jgi:hypothetical protein
MSSERVQVLDPDPVQWALQHKCGPPPPKINRSLEDSYWEHCPSDWETDVHLFVEYPAVVAVWCSCAALLFKSAKVSCVLHGLCLFLQGFLARFALNHDLLPLMYMEFQEWSDFWQEEWQYSWLSVIWPVICHSGAAGSKISVGASPFGVNTVRS